MRRITWLTALLLVASLAGVAQAQSLYASKIVMGSAVVTADGTIITLTGGLTVTSGGFTTDGTTGNTGVSGYIGLPSYVSQTTGWRIDNAGGADFRYLFADEMHVKAFIADLEQALAGGQIITKSVAVVSHVFACPAYEAAAYLFVRDLPSASDMQTFESGDWVVLRSFSRAAGTLTIGDCVGTVSGYLDGSGEQRWTFTRGTSGGTGGTMTPATDVQIDSLALDYGVSGNGYHEISAVDGAYAINSPYSQVVTWATAPVAANRTVRTRLGNLRGITATTEYGLIAGTYAATNGHYFRASDQAFELHGIDLKLFDGTSNTIRLAPAVPSFALGATLPTSCASGTGVWMGKAADASYDFCVGNMAGASMKWDGSAGTLTFVGDGAGLTAINGGNITTGTINVGAINATGFGDNVVKNGLFEGGTTAVQAVGWAQVEGTASASAGYGFASGGTNGPGLYVLSPPSTLTIGVGYTAVPVQAGQTYRVALDLYHASGTTTGIYVRMQESSSSAYVTRVTAGSGTFGGTTRSSFTDLLSDGALAAGWNALSYTYTVPSGVQWVTLSVYNWTRTTGTYSDVYVDNVEMQRQIGPGHIRAASITADRISTSTLSAIAADLGTITAGSISGVSATFGGGNVTLDSSGILFTAGTGTSNQVRWSDGTYLYSNGGSLYIHGNSGSLTLEAGSYGVVLGSGGFYSADDRNLGTATDPWAAFYVADRIYASGLPTATSGYPVVQTSGQLWYRTDGVNAASCGAGVDTITTEYGIVTSVGCLSPELTPVSLLARIQALEAQIAALQEKRQ
jgi:hypothetical protein